MCGRATLAMVASSAVRIVASITEATIMVRLSGFGCAPATADAVMGRSSCGRPPVGRRRDIEKRDVLIEQNLRIDSAQACAIGLTLRIDDVQQRARAIAVGELRVADIDIGGLHRLLLARERLLGVAYCRH